MNNNGQSKTQSKQTNWKILKKYSIASYICVCVSNKNQKYDEKFSEGYVGIQIHTIVATNSLSVEISIY